MNKDISTIIKQINPQYKGLYAASSERFIGFHKERNADESTINIFRGFRLAGQIALKDGLIFDENQVLICNEFFDEERTSCKFLWR